MRRSIITEIRAWKQGRNIPLPVYADEDLMMALREQRVIGWQEFLEGLISKKMVDYQRNYYHSISSNRSIHTWNTRIIRQGWHIILQLWESRNKQLQHPDQLYNLEGVPLLNKTILKEWDYGLGKLPILEFSPFFRIKKVKLMEKSVSARKDWLASIKMARKLYNDKTEDDEFDSNKTLQEWIGINI